MATLPRLQLETPPGRIVAGAVYQPATKKGTVDRFGKLQEADNWFFALAIPKTDPRLGGIIQQMFQFTYQCYGQNTDVLQRIQMGLRPNTNFAWKIQDGDEADVRGRPGYAGCMIFKFNTQLPIRCVGMDGQPIDANLFRTGYYADVAYSISPNGKVDRTAGIFMNPDFVRFLGQAEEIQPGPTAEQRFANIPAVQMGAPLPAAGAAPLGANLAYMIHNPPPAYSPPAGFVPSPQAQGYAPAMQPQYAPQQPAAPAMQPQYAPQLPTPPGANVQGAPGGAIGAPALPGAPACAPATVYPSNEPSPVAGFAYGVAR